MKALADNSLSDPRNADDDLCERRNRTLRAWLLAGLRFALTLDHADRLAVLACATELDRPGAQRGDMRDFSFFHWTSCELCAAIVDRSLPASPDIVREHLARIDDGRLKRAFASAIDMESAVELPKQASRPAKRVVNLWSGLGR